MVTVVSSAGPRGIVEYGQAFLDGFADFWPRATRLAFYVEDEFTHPRAECRFLPALQTYREFLRFCDRQPDAKGLGELPCWTRHDRQAGYSYRTDAMKFCRKVFAMADAARRAMDEGETILAWIDADVRTFNFVPKDWIEQLLGDDDLVYLGRDAQHSECGFMIFRLPNAWPLIRKMEDAYASLAVFQMREWHDSWVFDELRKDVAIRQRSLTRGRGHVWPASPLGVCLDHLKGDRKALGYSSERLQPR